VDVDPTRSYHETVRIDLAAAALAHIADRGDAVAVDSDVGPARPGAGAVDDHAAPDHDVVHGLRSYCRGVRGWRMISSATSAASNKTSAEVDVPAASSATMPTSLRSNGPAWSPSGAGEKPMPAVMSNP
jgi:hypothetical protein